MGNNILGSASFQEDLDEYMKRRRELYGEIEGEGPEPVPNIMEIRGFVIWIFTIISYFVFILWTLLPRDFLFYMGVTYYPSKYVSSGFRRRIHKHTHTYTQQQILGTCFTFLYNHNRNSCHYCICWCKSKYHTTTQFHEYVYGCIF